MTQTEDVVLALSIFSVVTFIGSIALVPFLIARAPVDFFVSEHKPSTPVEWLRWSLRNAFGVALIVLGAAMLVLPGQGLLTLALCISLVDFPGKRKLQRAIVRKHGVSRSLAWIRQRAGQPPFVLP